jgi:hypothetical protein
MPSQSRSDKFSRFSGSVLDHLSGSAVKPKLRPIETVRPATKSQTPSARKGKALPVGKTAELKPKKPDDKPVESFKEKHEELKSAIKEEKESVEEIKLPEQQKDVQE